ncbi:MAG: antitoxin CptB [Thiomicrorhabdus sp.]|nr:MAG: antitoxin CptB [Thiomicrorhabdus sp.]
MDLTLEAFQNWRKKALFLAKRGNLESELLLVAYIDSLDQTISTEQIEIFEALLSENDQNLFCWLMEFNPKAPNDSVTPPAEYLSLVKIIRTNYLK